MTLIYKLDLDILKIYLPTKNDEVSMSRLSKVTGQTDRCNQTYVTLVGGKNDMLHSTINTLSHFLTISN